MAEFLERIMHQCPHCGYENEVILLPDQQRAAYKCMACRRDISWDRYSDSMVDHPNHYQTKAGLEAIDIIDAFTDDLTGIEAFDTGNVLKYICRWKHKNGLEDLEKAAWYLNHLINHIKKENE